MDSLQSVVAWVYVSMSDKVVGRLMRRRGSAAAEGLVCWNSLRQSNSVRQYRISAFSYDSVVGSTSMTVRRAISSFLVKSNHRTLRIRHYNSMNSEELTVFRMKLTFTLWQHYVSWQAQNIVQFIPLLVQLQTRVLHWMALFRPYILVRCMMYAGTSSVFTGRCFGFSVSV